MPKSSTWSSALPWTHFEHLRVQDIQVMIDFVVLLHQRASKTFNMLHRILASHVHVEAMPCERMCLKSLLDAGLDKRGTLIHIQGMLLFQLGRSSCLEFQNKVWPLFAHCAFVRADSSRSIESDPSCTSVACVPRSRVRMFEHVVTACLFGARLARLRVHVVLRS
mmetsp:Transcript_63967/g.208670  ORF Transcript_63967/g.208670 Transcript_63967/m.208670 type:complete len:165 (-) Transcript_63967:63-557(-)